MNDSHVDGKPLALGSQRNSDVARATLGFVLVTQDSELLRERRQQAFLTKNVH